MPLPEPLQKIWNRLAPRAFEPLPVLNGQGLQLGKTILAHWHNGRLLLEDDRVQTLLSVAYAREIPHSVIRAIHNAEKSWKSGDKLIALTHLSLTGLHAITFEQGQRLFAADWALNRGVTPEQLFKFAGLHKDGDSDDEDDDDDDSGGDDESGSASDNGNGHYNPDEPRVPAGQPGGGQWTSGGSSASNSGSISNPPADGSADRLDESYGLDAVIGLAGAAAAAEVLTSATAAAIAARVSATVTATRVSLAGMGTAAVEKAEELYDSLQESISNWLNHNAPDVRDLTIWDSMSSSAPLNVGVARTFKDGIYTEEITNEEVVLYRVYGGTAPELGSFWTRTAPIDSYQAINDLALNPKWGNTAENLTIIKVPPGVTIYEGIAASQENLGGGGNQIYIPKVDHGWLFK